jgi:hypothetical protein
LDPGQRIWNREYRKKNDPQKMLDSLTTLLLEHEDLYRGLKRNIFKIDSLKVPVPTFKWQGRGFMSGIDG